MAKTNSSITYREIYRQPPSFKAINDTLTEIFKTLDEVFGSGENYDELIFTGCGTSMYLAQASAQAFSAYNAVPSRAVPCSELFFFPETYVKGRKVLVLPITRNSCTSEVRMAIDRVRAYPFVKTLAITCDKRSAEYNDYMILSPDTAEDSVIMTRSFTSMVYLAVIMAMYEGGKKDKILQMKDYDKISVELLEKMDAITKQILDEHPNLNLFITLGQGVYYGIANECMNKMKEMGLANSEAYYSMEYRHGPMSLVDENTLIVTLANPHTLDTDAKLLTQMNSYGAVTVAIGDKVSQAMPDAVYSLDMGYGFDEMQYAGVIGFIGQFLGYHISMIKKIDADSPRHLSQAIVLK
jgi:glucosamine--fructose-6-phosphate aminotransferase (isomerizing)